MGQPNRLWVGETNVRLSDSCHLRGPTRLQGSQPPNRVLLGLATLIGVLARIARGVHFVSRELKTEAPNLLQPISVHVVDLASFIIWVTDGVLCLLQQILDGTFVPLQLKSFLQRLRVCVD